MAQIPTRNTQMIRWNMEWALPVYAPILHSTFNIQQNSTERGETIIDALPFAGLITNALLFLSEAYRVQLYASHGN